MNYFLHQLERDISSYEGRHNDLIYSAPAFYKLLTRMLDDPRLPGRLKPLIIASIAYFILPNDVIPEGIFGPYGFIDDIFLSALIANRICQEVNQDILINNWDGETNIISLIDEILLKEKELIGDKRGRILDYIGYDYLGDNGKLRHHKGIL